MNKMHSSAAALARAFPDIDPGFKPLGSRIIVQFRMVRKQTDSGIHLPDTAAEHEHHNTQVAKVLAVGPVAFRDRNSLEQWPEGAWAKAGDFVRVPRHAGDIQEVRQADGSVAKIGVFEDTNLIGIITGDPLEGSATY